MRDAGFRVRDQHDFVCRTKASSLNFEGAYWDCLRGCKLRVPLTKVQCHFTAHFTPIKVLGISSVKILLAKWKWKHLQPSRTIFAVCFLSPPGSLDAFVHAYFFPDEKMVQVNAASSPSVGAYLEWVLSNASREQQ